MLKCLIAPWPDDISIRELVSEEGGFARRQVSLASAALKPTNTDGTDSCDDRARPNFLNSPLFLATPLKLPDA